MRFRRSGRRDRCGFRKTWPYFSAVRSVKHYRGLPITDDNLPRWSNNVNSFLEVLP